MSAPIGWNILSSLNAVISTNKRNWIYKRSHGYSHLSNKREVMLTILKNSTLHKNKSPPPHIYWFLIYFPTKLIPNDKEGHSFSFRTNLVPFRIFRHPLHAYSLLHVWCFCIFCTPSVFIPTSRFIREMRVRTLQLIHKSYRRQPPLPGQNGTWLKFLA